MPTRRFSISPTIRPPADIPDQNPPVQNLAPPGETPRRPRRADRRCSRCRRPRIRHHRSRSQRPSGPAQAQLQLAARYGSNLPQITSGLHWRIYPVKPDQGGFRPLKEDKGAAPVFSLPPGNYVVHVGFGLASATRDGPGARRRQRARSSRSPPAACASPAGSATSRIPSGQVWFDLFPGSQFESGDRRAHRAVGRGRRRDPGAGRLVSHRLALRRRQLGGALRHPRAEPAS